MAHSGADGILTQSEFEQVVRTATKVVAGANADAACKSLADFVCVGVDDDVQIQAAIDALTSGRTWKETVKLIGKFDIATQIHIDADFTAIDASEAEFTLTGDNGILTTNGKSDIDIIGGVYDGASGTLNPFGIGVSSGSERVTIYNPYVKNCYFCGIYTFGCKSVLIVNPITDTCGRMPNPIGGIEVAYDAHDIEIVSHDSTSDYYGLNITGQGGAASVYNIIYTGIIRTPYYEADTSSGGSSINLRDCHYCNIKAISDTPVRFHLLTGGITYTTKYNTADIVGYNAGRSAMYMDAATYNDIKIVSHSCSITTNNTYPVAYVKNSNYNYINVIANEEHVNKAKYAIEENGTSDYNKYDLIATNQVTGQALILGSNSKIESPTYITENHGLASNVTLDASGIGAIAHGCDVTPTYANVICQSANLNIRVSSIDTTNINIYVFDLDGAAVTADTHDFYWYVR